MNPLAPGSPAPPIEGVDLSKAPTALFFYKVTCPVCQMAAPKVRAFAEAYPGRIVGVGQDPALKLAAFDLQYRLGFHAVTDLPPYPASNAYGIRVVPTLFLVDGGGAIADVAESWDRKGLNRVSKGLAELAGAVFRPVSEPDDGLPPFRPG